jgi:hypothetical protein
MSYAVFQMSAKQPASRRNGKANTEPSANLEEVVAGLSIQLEPQPLRGWKAAKLKFHAHYFLPIQYRFFAVRINK